MVCIRIRNTTNYSKNGDYSKAIDFDSKINLYK